jgi:hypothetical protein
LTAARPGRNSSSESDTGLVQQGDDHERGTHEGVSWPSDHCRPPRPGSRGAGRGVHRLRLAELDVERAAEANLVVPGSIGGRELERLRNHVEVMRRQVDIARTHSRISAREATIAAVEAIRENARADLAAAVEANQRTPGTISRVNVDRLRAKAELADIRLALCRSPGFELSLLAEMQWSIEQLTDEVIDLRHQIDSKAAGDAGR